MPKRARSAADAGLPAVSCRAAIETMVSRLIDLLDQFDGDPDLEPSLGSIGPSLCGSDDQRFWAQGDPGADAELDTSDLEAEADEDSLGAPVGDGNQERWVQGDDRDREAQGTADDLELHASTARYSADRIALFQLERQVQALARRLRRRGTPGHSQPALVAEPAGNLRLLECS